MRSALSVAVAAALPAASARYPAVFIDPLDRIKDRLDRLREFTEADGLVYRQFAQAMLSRVAEGAGVPLELLSAEQPATAYSSLREAIRAGLWAQRFGDQVEASWQGEGYVSFYVSPLREAVDPVVSDGPGALTPRRPAVARAVSLSPSGKGHRPAAEGDSCQVLSAATDGGLVAEAGWKG